MASEPDDQEVGSSGVRSPRYPSMALKEAVAKTKAIYDADKTAGSPVRSALARMGYRSKSGPATAALGALKRFGLIESREGRVYPTTRAVTILRLPEEDQRRKEALREAVLAPSLYRQLVDQYRESGLPSPESLEHELILGGKFNHNAIPGFVKDFFESLKFAGLTDENGVLSGFVERGAGHDDEEGEDDEEDDPKAVNKRRRPMTEGTKEDVYTLAEGDVVLQWPIGLSQKSLAEVEDWLGLMLRKLKRTAQEAAQQEE
jgi:hypothetical protein